MFLKIYNNNNNNKAFLRSDTHYIAGEVWQRNHLLAEPVVNQKPSQHNIQVEEVGAETEQVSDNLNTNNDPFKHLTSISSIKQGARSIKIFTKHIDLQFLAPDRSSRSHNLRPSVRPFVRFKFV